MSRRVLVVDDDADMCRELARTLEQRGFEVIAREDADAAFEVVLATELDVVVTDVRMRGMNGLELCDRIVQNRRDLPVIVVTAFGSLDAAVAAIRVGAYDFLTKPFLAEQLLVAVERALRQRELEADVKRLRQENVDRSRFGAILGTSVAMTAVLDMIARVAESDATVLVTAESGTGKELVARAIHEASARAKGPLVTINCAAVPEALLESELFGHTQGAFTDAKAPRRGLFVEASGGTLFLDEVGEMPVGMQAKLLRALEERKVRPVGGAAEIAFDARIVAATNRDLDSLAVDGRFRSDLLYRLDVVRIEVPPLRSRGSDVLLLAQSFVERFAKRHGKKVSGLSPAVAEKLLAYAWPGNVRELSNAMERAVALARLEEIVVDDLPPKIRDYRASDVIVASGDPSELVTLEEVERRYIARVMEAVAWNKTEATRVLGIDRSTLYRKLERYRIGAPDG